MMSNQPENEKQQAETVSAEALREYLLTEIEASKQAVAELSDEQLEESVRGARKRHHDSQVSNNSTVSLLTSGVLRGIGLGIFFKQPQDKD